MKDGEFDGMGEIWIDKHVVSDWDELRVKREGLVWVMVWT